MFAFSSFKCPISRTKLVSSSTCTYIHILFVSWILKEELKDKLIINITECLKQNESACDLV